MPFSDKVWLAPGQEIFQISLLIPPFPWDLLAFEKTIKFSKFILMATCNFSFALKHGTQCYVMGRSGIVFLISVIQTSKQHCWRSEDQQEVTPTGYNCQLTSIMFLFPSIWITCLVFSQCTLTCALLRGSSSTYKEIFKKGNGWAYIDALSPHGFEKTVVSGERTILPCTSGYSAGCLGTPRGTSSSLFFGNLKWISDSVAVEQSIKWIWNHYNLFAFISSDI